MRTATGSAFEDTQSACGRHNGLDPGAVEVPVPRRKMHVLQQAPRSVAGGGLESLTDRTVDPDWDCGCPPAFRDATSRHLNKMPSHSLASRAVFFGPIAACARQCSRSVLQGDALRSERVRTGIEPDFRPSTTPLPPARAAVNPVLGFLYRFKLKSCPLMWSKRSHKVRSP